MWFLTALEAAKNAKQLAGLPGFWELIGAFFGMLVVGFGLYKMIDFWLTKADVLKNPDTEKILAEIKRLQADIERLKPFATNLLPEGVSIEFTPFWEALQKLKAQNPELGKEIVKHLLSQQQQIRLIIAILKHMGGESKSMELLIDVLEGKQHDR